MKYFKDSSNNVFAYEIDGSQDHLIGDKIPISFDESVNINNQKIQAEYDALNYAEKRKNEYPSIGDQLDALYHAGVFPPDMAEKISQVKAKFPKN